MALVKIASNTKVKLEGKTIFRVPTNQLPENGLKPNISNVIQFNSQDIQYNNEVLTFNN
jgi:hypothetical protein